MGLEETELKPLVDSWRKSNPRIVQLWWDVDKAVKECVKERTSSESHDYQKFAAEHIINNPVAALFLDMGLGKTVITLSAIQELMYERFEVRKVLVIAPLRVGRDTWPQEIEKWDHLKGLKYSVAIGTETERKVALMAKASIYIINRENVEWLVKNCTFDFDMSRFCLDGRKLDITNGMRTESSLQSGNMTDQKITPCIRL